VLGCWVGEWVGRQHSITRGCTYSWVRSSHLDHSSTGSSLVWQTHRRGCAAVAATATKVAARSGRSHQGSRLSKLAAGAAWATLQLWGQQQGRPPPQEQQLPLNVPMPVRFARTQQRNAGHPAAQCSSSSSAMQPAAAAGVLSACAQHSAGLGRVWFWSQRLQQMGCNQSGCLPGGCVRAGSTHQRAQGIVSAASFQQATSLGPTLLSFSRRLRMLLLCSPLFPALTGRRTRRTR
jgi:hypothetical protein